MNKLLGLCILSLSMLSAVGCNPSSSQAPEQDSTVSALKATDGTTPITNIIVIPDDNDSCTFNGKVVYNNQSVDAYQNSSVPYGSQCVSEKRICNVSVLSGSFQFASCAVDQPASCLFNGKTVAHGESVDAYANSTVAYGSQCAVEKRTCNNGVLSGSSLYAACAADQPASCLFNGKTIEHGTVLKAFSSSAVKFGQLCQSEDRTCQNGVLSGSFVFESCEAGQPAACSFNGQTVAHGQIIKAFQNSSVQYGSSCVSEDRTCTDGQLSGVYQYGSCAVDQPASCLFNGQTVAHGQIVKAFASSAVAYGSSCQSEDRTCSNGALSGSNKYASCAVDQPASCLFNGQTVAHGQIVKAFASSAVAYGSSCKSEERTCQNGVLSGSNKYASCEVDKPASCLFNGQTVAHGQIVKAFASSAVAYGSSCQSEDRTCSNGVLSGSYKSESCVVSQALNCSFNGQVVLHGKSVTAYESSKVKCDQKCLSQVRTCTNGQLSGSYSQVSCAVETKPKWVATEEWTKCSLDCGGRQQRVYKCLGESGQVVDSSLCGIRIVDDNNKLKDERACDGNPDKYKKTVTTKSEEDAPSSKLCPANQIGVIFKSREVTRNTTIACKDHKVQKVSEEVLYSAWKEENYCKDYTPYRCSQDSINNDEAKGRYDWMVKCQSKLPVVKEFLENFDHVLGMSTKNKDPNVNTGEVSIESKRRLYPTFIDAATGKPWIAPKKADAECMIPKKAYVAAVCVSSCATPEQEILVQIEESKKFKSQTFLESLKNQTKFVASLHADKGQDDDQKLELRKTKVENWVTEMMDTEHDIIVFKMKSGGELRLTPNHPLVTVDGKIKLAADFKSGESLLKLGGEKDPIVSLEHIKYFGKVYNLFVNSSDKLKNIVVTNGYLNGTAYYQNEGADNVNKKILKTRLLKDAFQK